MRKKHPMSLAKLRYARHKAQAKFRNIGFYFTFEDWYDWWMQHGVDKNKEVKWQNNYRPCMCRNGDNGNYERNNVYFANHLDNVSDARKNNKMNPHGALTDKNYRYGDKTYTLYELKALNLINFEHRIHYRVETYDELNKKESLKLINRYRGYLPHKFKKMWETPAGMFDNMSAAAESVGMNAHRFKYYVDKGKYKKHIIRLVPTLKEYIIQNSKYPDPYIPEDLGEDQ